MNEEPSSNDQQFPPYVIEGARSGRSRCKTCRRQINKGVLRIGLLIEGPYGTGYLWHHLTCAARRQLEAVEDAYAMQAWQHAKEVPEAVPPIEELRKQRDDAETRKKTRKTLPYVEEAPSGRSRCKHCEQPIAKGGLRVVLGRGVHFGSQVRTAPINVHPECVAAEIEADDCTTEKEGFVEALRTNSEGVPGERIDAVLSLIGDLA